jgi:hypothetical protein
MKYLITESQYNLLMESDFIKKLRRRFNEKTMRDFIYHAETEFPDPCEKFDNEFEYADTIINQAVDDFLFQDELWEYFHSGDWPVVKNGLKTDYWGFIKQHVKMNSMMRISI